MNRDLLEMAIAELKRVHEAQLDFDYGVWGKDRSCGTVACAGGYLVLFKPFRDLGLGYVAKDDLTPTFGGIEGDEALARFFGISIAKAESAFVFLEKELDKVLEDVTALDVANKLQEYLDADAVSP